MSASFTRRQRDTIHVARLLGSGLPPAQAIRQSGLPRGSAAARVRQLRHLRLPPFVLREVMRLAPGEQFGQAVLHLILTRKWEQKARTMLARRQKGGQR